MEQDFLTAQFPILENGVFCNHAAISPWPACAAEAVQQFAAENYRVGPAHYAQWVKREYKLREQLALLIGAPSTTDIALLKNTSLASQVTVAELFFQSELVGSRTFNPDILLIAGAIDDVAAGC